MKFSRRVRPGERPKYEQEATDPNKKKEEHTPGWPHFDLKGNCICLCSRCMGPAGCKCYRCAGIGHVNCSRADTLTDGSRRERIQP